MVTEAAVTTQHCTVMNAQRFYTDSDNNENGIIPNRQVNYNWRKAGANYEFLSGGLLLLLASNIINFAKFFAIATASSKSDLLDTDDNKNPYGTHTMITVLMWYVGAFIGSFSSGFERCCWPARQVNYVGSALLCIAGIFFTLSNRNENFLCAARFIAGLCHGFVYNTLIAQIGDNTIHFNRGYEASQISYSMPLGMLMVVISSIVYDRSGNTLVVSLSLGVFVILLCVGSVLLTWRYTRDSITQLIRFGQEFEAQNTLSSLHNKAFNAWTIQADFKEKKLMVAEDFAPFAANDNCQHIFSNGNTRPVVWITGLKILNVLVSNMALTIFQIIGVYSSKYAYSNLWVVFLLFAMRAILVLVPKYFTDVMGRYLFLVISGFGCCATLVAFSVDFTRSVMPHLTLILVIMIQAFIALGIDPLQHIYAAEAFPLSKRNASLAFVTCIEHITHGLIVLWFIYWPAFVFHLSFPFLEFYVHSPSVLVALLLVYLLSNLPETSTLSLRQCRDSFKKTKETNTTETIPSDTQPSTDNPFASANRFSTFNFKIFLPTVN